MVVFRERKFQIAPAGLDIFLDESQLLRPKSTQFDKMKQLFFSSKQAPTEKIRIHQEIANEKYYQMETKRNSETHPRGSLFAPGSQVPCEKSHPV